MIRSLVATLFGAGRNLPVEIIEALRPNAEAADARSTDLDIAAMSQFAAEFTRPSKGWFDQFVDGLNRLPRPLLTLGVFIVLMLPVFDLQLATEVFTAWSIIPAAVWTMIAIVISFFFGGRMQVADIDFTRDMAGAAAALPRVVEQLRHIREISAQTPQAASPRGDASTILDATQPDINPALEDWLDREGRG